MIDREQALSESTYLRSDSSSIIQKGSTNFIKISYKLPTNLYIGNNAKKQLAIWVKEKQQWILDSDLIDKENIVFTHEGYIELHTYRLAPICYM